MSSKRYGVSPPIARLGAGGLWLGDYSRSLRVGQAPKSGLMGLPRPSRVT